MGSGVSKERATQRSKRSREFSGGCKPRVSAGMLGDGAGMEAGLRAVEWPLSRPMGMPLPARGGPAPSQPAVLTFPTSALPMEMTLMRRDLAGSLRFGGTLASIALALPRLPLPVSLLHPAGQPRPSGLLAQWRNRCARHRPGPAARHPQPLPGRGRTRAVGKRRAAAEGQPSLAMTARRDVTAGLRRTGARRRRPAGGRASLLGLHSVAEMWLSRGGSDEIRCKAQPRQKF